MLRQKTKSETAQIHKFVEGLPTMKKIMDSTITPTQYHRYLSDIFRIYQALESKMATVLPDLTQPGYSDHIMNDLSSLGGILDESHPAASYCKYIMNISRKTRLLAHIYVRFYADAYGGKIIARKLKANNLPIESYKGKLDNSIEDYINTRITDHDAFIAEVHVAYLSYCGILLI